MQRKETRNFSTLLYILLGFLCATPLLGGIVGLALVLLGFIIYRNRVLIIMGAMGIFITVIMMFILKYNETHRGVFDKSRIVNAKNWLNDLIKEIELYKLNNGFYPENMDDLKKINPLLVIKDPLQQVNPQLPDHNFFYKREDQKYYLFSKGFDGIPFTSDDLLPSMQDMNSNKLGIIISLLPHDSIP